MKKTAEPLPKKPTTLGTLLDRALMELDRRAVEWRKLGLNKRPQKPRVVAASKLRPVENKI